MFLYENLKYPYKKPIFSEFLFVSQTKNLLCLSKAKTFIHISSFRKTFLKTNIFIKCHICTCTVWRRRDHRTFQMLQLMTFSYTYILHTNICPQSLSMGFKAEVAMDSIDSFDSRVMRSTTSQLRGPCYILARSLFQLGFYAWMCKFLISMWLFLSTFVQITSFFNQACS